MTLLNLQQNLTGSNPELLEDMSVEEKIKGFEYAMEEMRAAIVSLANVSGILVENVGMLHKSLMSLTNESRMMKLSSIATKEEDLPS